MIVSPELSPWSVPHDIEGRRIELVEESLVPSFLRKRRQGESP